MYLILLSYYFYFGITNRLIGKMFLSKGIGVFNRFDPDTYRDSVCEIEQVVSGDKPRGTPVVA